MKILLPSRARNNLALVEKAPGNTPKFTNTAWLFEIPSNYVLPEE